MSSYSDDDAKVIIVGIFCDGGVLCVVWGRHGGRIAGSLQGTDKKGVLVRGVVEGIQVPFLCVCVLLVIDMDRVLRVCDGIARSAASHTPRFLLYFLFQQQILFTYTHTNNHTKHSQPPHIHPQ